MTKDTKSTVPVKKKKKNEGKKVKKKSYKMRKRKKKKEKKWAPISGIEPCTFGIALAHELFMNTDGQPYDKHTISVLL